MHQKRLTLPDIYSIFVCIFFQTILINIYSLNGLGQCDNIQRALGLHHLLPRHPHLGYDQGRQGQEEGRLSWHMY